MREDGVRAAMVAAGQNVHHLTAIIDYNNGRPQGGAKRLCTEPLAAKWKPSVGMPNKLTDMILRRLTKHLMRPGQRPRNKRDRGGPIKGKTCHSWRMTAIGITERK